MHTNLPTRSVAHAWNHMRNRYDGRIQVICAAVVKDGFNGDTADNKFYLVEGRVIQVCQTGTIETELRAEGVDHARDLIKACPFIVQTRDII